jgi:hypothetical protein
MRPRNPSASATPTAKISAYVYFENESGRRMAIKRFTRDEARRIVAKIAKFPDLPRR